MTQQSLAEREQTLKNTEQENIRRLRERAEQREREQQHKINELEQKLAQAQKASKPQINDDDVVEGRYHKELAEEVSSVKEELRKTREAQEATLGEMKARAEIPNLDQVVNQQNLDMLKSQYPHLYNTIFSANSFYDRAKIAHTLITQMQLPQQQESQSRMYENSQKPQGTRTGALQNKYMYDQNNLSPEESDRIYKDAMRYASGAF